MIKINSMRLAIIFCFILINSTYSLTVIDSLKQASANKFNLSLMENAVLKAITASTKKVTGKIYFKIEVDSQLIIQNCRLLDSISSYSDSAFSNLVKNSVEGSKYYYHRIGNSQIPSKLCDVYKVKIEYGILNGIQKYKKSGKCIRRKNHVIAHINKFLTKLDKAYTLSLSSQKYEGEMIVDLSINKKGS